MRAGFPHGRRALDALAAARSNGATEAEARLDALLRAGARGILGADGTSTEAGAVALTAFDDDLHISTRAWSRCGSAGLFAGPCSWTRRRSAH